MSLDPKYYKDVPSLQRCTTHLLSEANRSLSAFTMELPHTPPCKDPECQPCCNHIIHHVFQSNIQICCAFTLHTLPLKLSHCTQTPNTLPHMQAEPARPKPREQETPLTFASCPLDDPGGILELKHVEIIVSEQREAAATVVEPHT